MKDSDIITLTMDRRTARDITTVLTGVLSVIPDDDAHASLRDYLAGRIETARYRAPELDALTWQESAFALADWTKEHQPPWADEAQRIFVGEPA